MNEERAKSVQEARETAMRVIAPLGDARGVYAAALDALIEAVRAEERERVWVNETAHKLSLYTD